MMNKLSNHYYDHSKQVIRKIEGAIAILSVEMKMIAKKTIRSIDIIAYMWLIYYSKTESSCHVQRF